MIFPAMNLNLLLALTRILCASSVVISHASTNNVNTKEQSSRNLRKFDETCTAVLVCTQRGGRLSSFFETQKEEHDGLSIECLTPSGMTYKVPSADKAFIQNNFIDGDFVSGETDMVFEQESVLMMGIDTSELVLDSPPKLIKKEYEVSGNGRKPATTGKRTVLAVRVVLSDVEVTSDEDSIRDSIFGTDGDVVNLQTQFSRCSHDQLNFKSTGTIAGNTLTINDGVLTIKLEKYSSSDSEGAIRNQINRVIKKEFGQEPSKIADHVMYCQPEAVTNYIAFAYVNSWASVYSDQWCERPTAQMHEIGHNLNMAHSGQNGNEYGDYVGVMGSAWEEDDTWMCFNAAKSWQLGWYSTSAIKIDATGVRAYEGDVAGIIEDPFSANVPIIIKLNTSNKQDYFLNFNRVDGFNRDTWNGFNKVVVTKAGNGGNGYSQSWVQARLSVNDSWKSPAVFDGEKVTVTVNSIGTRANVKICVGKCPTELPPSVSPTLLLSSCIEDSQTPFSWAKNSGVVATKDCGFLQGREQAQIRNLCKKERSSDRDYRAAKHACKVTCGTCLTDCTELTSGKFFLKRNQNGNVHKNCKWLAERNSAKIERLCGVEDSPSKFKSAKEVCPVTCGGC